MNAANATTTVLTITDDSVVVANDCSFTGRLYGSGRVELSGTITLDGSIADALTVVAKAGTYNFDPTAYVDAANYTVTANANSTWTVAAKTVE